MMQRDRELDDAESGAEMPAGDRHCVYGLQAQFVGELAQLALLKPPQIFRQPDSVEQRGL
jgi:hypothetical protein